jgi:hypothetical protein
MMGEWSAERSGEMVKASNAGCWWWDGEEEEEEDK